MRGLDVVVYNDADHGLTETFEPLGIARHRYPAGLTELIANRIVSSTLPPPRGNLVVLRPKA
jgi:hypothetical protein